MANKNKYSVTSKFGTFTRSTNRTYSHMVVICGRGEDVLRAKAAEQLAYDKDLVVRYTEGVRVAQGTGFAGTVGQGDSVWVPVQQAGFGSGRVCGHSLTDIQQWLADRQEAVATSAARLEKTLADNLDRVSNRKGEDVGWASRLDLAVSNANKYRKLGYAAYVIEVATGNVVA